MFQHHHVPSAKIQLNWRLGRRRCWRQRKFTTLHELAAAWAAAQVSTTWRTVLKGSLMIRWRTDKECNDPNHRVFQQAFLLFPLSWCYCTETIKLISNKKYPFAKLCNLISSHLFLLFLPSTHNCTHWLTYFIAEPNFMSRFAEVSEDSFSSSDLVLLLRHKDFPANLISYVESQDSQFPKKVLNACKDSKKSLRVR